MRWVESRRAVRTNSFFEIAAGARPRDANDVSKNIGEVEEGGFCFLPCALHVLRTMYSPTKCL